MCEICADKKIIHLTEKLNSLNLGPLPTSLNISQNEPGNMLDIHWSSEGNDYCIQSSHMRVTGSWNYAATGFYTLPLENKTYELTIALHPVMNMAPNFTISNFTIGKCYYSSGALGWWQRTATSASH